MDDASETPRRIDDLRLVLAAVARAGERVARDFGSPGEVRQKEPGQPVTQADLVADRMLRERLLGARPDYGWLSEETTDAPERLGRERVWIVDPIDGTRSFVGGYPESVVCVGLAEDGVATVGVVLNPVTGELYWAVRGAGAYGVLLADARHVEVEGPASSLVRVDDVDAIGPDGWGRFMIVHDVVAPPPEPKRMMVSRHDEWAPDDLPPGWVRTARGSTAYKMVGVAVGAGEGYFARGAKREWDVCAAALIVEESGGRVSDLGGAPLRYNRRDTRVGGVVCALDAGVHQDLLEWLGRRTSGDGGPAGGTT